MNCVYLLAMLGTFVFLHADLTQAAEIGDGVKNPEEKKEKSGNIGVDVQNILESGNFEDDKALIDVFKKLEPGVTVEITPLEKDGLERMLEVALGCGHDASKSRQKRRARADHELLYDAGAREACSASCDGGSCNGTTSCSCIDGEPVCN